FDVAMWVHLQYDWMDDDTTSAPNASFVIAGVSTEGTNYVQDPSLSLAYETLLPMKYTAESEYCTLAPSAG
ncbi:hypothetical protein KIPB_017382, partial [Kipferlia bialata]